MDEERATSFEMFLWGDRVHRAAAAFARAPLPPGVQLRCGSMGAVLSIPLSVPDAALEILVGRLDRSRIEGGVFFGVVPDRAIDGSQMLNEWTSTKRTAHVPIQRTRAQPSEDPQSGDHFESLAAVLSEALLL